MQVAAQKLFADNVSFDLDSMTSRKTSFLLSGRHLKAQYIVM